jgi:AraC-like DNA-binding protein
VRTTTHRNAKPDSSYEPHLVLNEAALQPGEEWRPCSPGWALIRIASGTGYWLHPRLNQELATGAVLMLAEAAQGSIRASQLGGVSLHFFHVAPQRLTGLATFSEQRFFETAGLREDLAMRYFQPESPVAAKLNELCAHRNGNGLPFRLQLLQLFVEVIGPELKAQTTKPEAPVDAQERLREFLERTSPSELLQIGFAELVQRTRCTPRHLSRVFHHVVGVSFRDKQAELRLARARELLVTSRAKVVDVALESGYQSLSLFNLMFKRRFGLSPGKWRQVQGGRKGRPANPRRRVVRVVAA